MVDVASIVVAVISGVLALSSAIFTAWVAYYSDQRKQRAEARALRDKYCDPLTQSAYDLQSRLYGIVQCNVLDTEEIYFIERYTAYLVGQYLSWVWIFRLEAQFLRHSEDAVNKKLMLIMDRIADEFAIHEDDNDFMFSRGHQNAIGELMTTVREGQGRQLFPMGFATFDEKYRNDEVLSGWFRPFREGFAKLSRPGGDSNSKSVFAGRLRRLQHLLIDLVMLMKILDNPQYPKSKLESAGCCACESLECCKAKSAAFKAQTRLNCHVGDKCDNHYLLCKRSYVKAFDHQEV